VIEQTDNSIFEKRHSRLGIASVIIAIFLPILFICPIIIAAIVDTTEGTYSKIFMSIGIAVGVSAPLLHLIGIIFGIIGWRSKKTKNLFPVMGTCLNAILLIIGFAIIVFILSNLKFGFN
jgi:hypothetical protein